MGRYALACNELDEPARALYGVAPGKNEVGIVGMGMAESVPNAVDRSSGMRGAAYPEGVEVAVNVVLYVEASSSEPDCKQYPDPYALLQM